MVYQGLVRDNWFVSQVVLDDIKKVQMRLHSAIGTFSKLNGKIKIRLIGKIQQGIVIYLEVLIKMSSI